MKIEFICNYCNHNWVESIWSPSAIEGKRCNVCRDPNLKTKQLDEVHGRDVFGYRFSPPFPKKEEEYSPVTEWRLD